MLDWHVQTIRSGQSEGKPGTFSSARAAIDAANRLLSEHQADEVIVYHRLYSDQAFLQFSGALGEIDIAPKAAHLEQQARRAAHSG